MTMTAQTSDWLRTTVTAVRELMIRRLEADSLDQDARREVEMALEELDVMWEELQGQADLLSRENERYAEFFDFAPDAYLITDTGGNIREANQAAAELLGAPREKLLGQPVGVRLPATCPATWRGSIRTPGGATLEVDLSVRSIPLKKSGVGGICWLIRPVA
jgi:PAS domain-containing protein